MLEGKDFDPLEMVFPFAAVFLNRTTGQGCDYPMDRIHMMFPELEPWLGWKDCKEIGLDNLFGTVRVEVQISNALVKETFDVHCETGLYKLNFLLVDQIGEGLDWFGGSELLSSSAFQRLNDHTRWAYWWMLQWTGSDNRKVAGYVKKERSNLQDLQFSGTERTEDNTEGQGKSFREEGSCETCWENGDGPGETTGKRFNETLLRLLEDIGGQQSGKRPKHDVQLEFLKPWYMLDGMCQS